MKARIFDKEGKPMFWCDDKQRKEMSKSVGDFQKQWIKKNIAEQIKKAKIETIAC